VPTIHTVTDGSNPTPRGTAGPPLPPPKSTRPRIRAPRNPNYAARRMLVSSVAITAAVGVGLVAYTLTKEEDDTVVAVGGDWSKAVLIDRTTGALTPVDSDGAPDDTLPGSGRVAAVHADGDRLALVGTNQIAVTGLGDDEPTLVPFEPGSTVTRLAVVDELWLAVSQPSGGNIVLVDGQTGETIDIGAVTGISSPRFFVETLRHDADGTVFAVADAVNFQTVVVRPGQDEPLYLPAQPVTVGDGLAVTSQVVGQRSRVTLFDGEEERATVQMALPAGGVIDGDGVVIVTVDGDVVRFGEGDEQPEQLGSVSVPGGATIKLVRPTADGSRLVVFGDVFEAVLDLSGETLFTTTFATAIEAPTIDPEWRCLPIGSGTTYHSLIELETGEQLADLTGVEVTGTSADGCSVLGLRGQVTELTGDGGRTRLGPLRAAWLAPDGQTVLTQGTTGEMALVTVDDWIAGDPIDLSRSAPANPQVAFLE
jgi:hypothetical protein